jgi:hypothetical protein
MNTYLCVRLWIIEGIRDVEMLNVRFDFGMILEELVYKFHVKLVSLQLIVRFQQLVVSVDYFT